MTVYWDISNKLFLNEYVPTEEDFHGIRDLEI